MPQGSSSKCCKCFNSDAKPHMVIIPCGHEVCQPCLENQFGDVGSATKCPVCQKAVGTCVPKNGAKGGASWRSKSDEDWYCSSSWISSQDQRQAPEVTIDTGSEKRQKAFELLLRDWQSMKMGHITCRVCADVPEILEVIPAPRVDTSSKESPQEILATIEIDSGNAGSDTMILLSMKVKRSRAQIRAQIVSDSKLKEGHTLALCKKSSAQKRLFWRDGEGHVLERWDGHLLDAAREAAEWLAAQSLPESASQLQQALEHLRDEPTQSTLTVGLCTATMNRLWQLKRALPLNLLQAWPHRNWSRFHVVNCASTDGETLQWLVQTCRAAMDVGLLNVYTIRPEDFPYWHASIGKNCAHIVATEDLLVNVDNDNLIGAGFAFDIVERYRAGYTVMHYHQGDGTCGRIVCRREDFIRIRGYDEDAYPMGAQDIDLLDRLRMLQGAHYCRPKKAEFCNAIPNTAEDKIRSCKDHGIKWSKMDTVNRDIFYARKDAGQIIRNTHKVSIGVPVELVEPEAHLES